MITLIRIRERGATPGILKRVFNRLSKEAFRDAATEHHIRNTAKRFTTRHASRAKYAKRKGENMPAGSPRANRMYYHRKKRSKQGGGVGRADPLVFSGASKAASAFATITSTARRARIRYNTPTFNRRPRNSRIRMRDEFVRILPEEEREFAANYDEGLDKRLDRVSEEQTTTIK